MGNCLFGRAPAEPDDPATGGGNKDAVAAADDESTSAAKVSPSSVSPKELQGWPTWLVAAAGDALEGWAPRRADSFQKLDKIGQGTYSNVYKARDLLTGKIVALKKVRFDIMELESARFMAREICILRRLNHPNIIKLEGLVISRVSHSIYLVFEYMEHDLSGLAASPGIQFTEAQVKCYMKQLLSGLEHCHDKGVLHRDIKGSNLLIDDKGILKIADFGLASTFDPNKKEPMTSRVVTLWYRPPELLLGATYYGVGVDLWSTGCILAELLAGKPILPGRTEVEQLHRIFKLCGSPSEKYWKKSKLPHATMFKPQQSYRRCIDETFKQLPQCSIQLIGTLLSIDPDERGTATGALNSEFFTTPPLACDPSTLPHYPPSKEIDAKLRDEKDRRQKRRDAKRNGAKKKKSRVHDRGSKAIPAPTANAELPANLERRKMVAIMNATSKSEKFPPPHQDGAVGNTCVSFGAPDSSFASFLSESSTKSGKASEKEVKINGKLKSSKRSTDKEEQTAASENFSRLIVDIRKNARIYRKTKGKELEVFGGSGV